MVKKSETLRRRSFKGLRRPVYIWSILLIALAVYAITDYRGPDTIKVKKDNFFGLPCLKARDLVVQEYDYEGSLIATRGMIIYKLKKGSDRFEKLIHVPTGFSVFWLRNFTLLRILTQRPECVEVVMAENGDICAVSAGYVWYLNKGERKFRNTLKLDHYGFGDQGIRNNGIVSLPDSSIYIGEYFRNPEKSEVCLFKSKDNGKSWETAVSFAPGEIRHIHAVTKDNYDEKIWINSGDSHRESMICYTEDHFKTIVHVGQGSEMWRVCQLLYAQDVVYWATDCSNDSVAGIYQWDRKTHQVKKIARLHGAVLHATRLSNGTIVMGVHREGMTNEKDDRTRLLIIDKDNKIKQITCGTWKFRKPAALFTFASLRLQRNQGSPALAVTCINQKEINNGDLIIIEEDTLISATE